MHDNHSQDPIDPRLAELLDQLREVPQRDPEQAARSQGRFLAELEELPFPAAQPTLWQRILRRIGLDEDPFTDLEDMNMTSKRSRLALTVAAAIIIVVTVLFGGSAATVLAAQSAIPGDALYGVKTTIEQTRLSLARDAASRADLQLQFAERRLQEIEKLVAEGRYQNIQAATQEFEAHVRNALNEIEQVAEGDPNLAASLMARITTQLSRYADSLGSLVNNLPEPLRTDVQRTIRTIRGERDNDNGNVNGNANESINANSNDDLSENNNDDLDENSNDDDTTTRNLRNTGRSAGNDNTNSNPDPTRTPPPAQNTNANDNDDYDYGQNDNDDGNFNNNGNDNDD